MDEERRDCLKTISDRIRGRMAEERVSVKSMSKTFHVSPRTWSNWMKDPETQLNIGKLRVIAVVLKTTPGALIGGESGKEV